MPTLVITINGPFAYVSNFSQTGDLTLMAPLCAQHLGGISTIDPDSQVILPAFNPRNHKPDLSDCERHLYELKFYAGQVTPSIPMDKFLSCPWPQGGFDARRWRFWLTMPMPDVIVPINPVYAQIVRPGPQQQPSSHFAIGARLIYRQWDGNPATLWHCNSPVVNPNTNKPVSFDFTECLKIDDHAYIEVEYASPLRDDFGHEDAVDCFETLMAVLGLPWSIFIPSNQPSVSAQPGQYGLLSSKLNDCLAAVAWVGSL
jgi:hypothetical protein